jgi:hypothetical protein
LIIRIWIEEREINESAMVWRGAIESVGLEEKSTSDAECPPSRRPFASFKELIKGLVTYLIELGIPEEQLQMQNAPDS